MLPIPNLDNRTFEQLVREARDLIPSVFPEWTDENEHDPGMTLLEMLAWHIELQQFQLDQLTDNHELKFLKLLGELPRDRTPSTTSVGFTSDTDPVMLPYGTLLHAEELPFETIRPVTVLPKGNKRVIVHTADETREIQHDIQSGNAPFYPFGIRAEAGARMEIEFDQPLPPALPLSLWIQLLDQEPNHRIPPRYTDFTPSGTIIWSYYQEAEGDQPESWLPVQLERDETYGLHQSGPVLFQIPEEAGTVTRLMAKLVDGSYNDPPYIRRLIWNEVFARQGQTMCIYEAFDDAPDLNEYRLQHALFRTGHITVQTRLESGGWIDMDDSLYSVHHADYGSFLRFTPEASLPSGRKCIRAIAVSPEFDHRIWCGTGNGLSGQVCRIPSESMLPDQFRLQVGWSEEGAEGIVWHDWTRVHDFDESDAESMHYIIDEQEGVIRFSDGVHGMVPPAASYPNIRINGYRTGVGEAGNIKENMTCDVQWPQPVKAVTLYQAYGGADPESLKQALRRTQKRILEPHCGVTSDDMEQLVMSIPGLRIARAKAIPSYNTTLQNYPHERALGHISVVIVPYSKRALPKPTEGMIRTVRTHLEPYRLLTTRLHVISPEYVKVTVRAVVVVDPRYEGQESEVEKVLSDWLKPFGDGSLTSGWAFGKPVQKSDVYDVIHRVPGILYIQDVWLMAEGKNVFREEGGDIHIPPNGLVYSGQHEIEFITSNRAGGATRI